MKLLIKITNWIKKETWWRRYYKRVTLDEKSTWNGRCIQCHAGDSTSIIRCSLTGGRECPCKYNQCLRRKAKL